MFSLAILRNHVPTAYVQHKSLTGLHTSKALMLHIRSGSPQQTPTTRPHNTHTAMRIITKMLHHNTTECWRWGIRSVGRIWPVATNYVKHQIPYGTLCCCAVCWCAMMGSGTQAERTNAEQHTLNDWKKGATWTHAVHFWSVTFQRKTNAQYWMLQEHGAP